MVSKTYYEILGVTKDSDDKDIKKAYRSLSMKYHPDRNSDPEVAETYKRINEAYETLSDPEKKAQYDNHSSGNIEHFEQHFSDVNDIFNMMFRGHGFQNVQGNPNIRVFTNHQGPGNSHFHHFQQVVRPKDISIPIIIDMKQSYSGCIIPKEITRTISTNHLKSSETETIYINIPRGIDNNEVLMIKEKGNIIDNVKSDLKINIQITDNVHFKRNGLDLIYENKITLKQSLCGFHIEFEHISGKNMNLNNTPPSYTIIKPGYKKIIPGYGMQRENVIGNMIFVFDIEFPDTLTSDQQTELDKIL